MPDCFCGCGRQVRLLDRSENKRGVEAKDLVDRFTRLRATLVTAESEQGPLGGVIPIPQNIEQLDERIAQLTFFSACCAMQIHGDPKLPHEWSSEKGKMKAVVQRQRAIAEQFESLLAMSPDELERLGNG